MSTQTEDLTMKRFRNLSFQYWLAMDVLLGLGLFGIVPGALPLAVALGVAQSFHNLMRERHLLAFPVQVRVAYLGLLVLGLWEPASFVHWLQFAATTILLVFDYCPLARSLALMPWNRFRPLTARFVWRTYLTPPVPGCILQALQAEP
jgi:hypothetical protein